MTRENPFLPVLRPRLSLTHLETERKVTALQTADYRLQRSRKVPRSCWRQLSDAIKNQLGHIQRPNMAISCPTLVLYGIRSSIIIGDFGAWKPAIS